MLYFPSRNTAAHVPALVDVTRLRQLLDNDVWAFSNCRVDAVGSPVAEVDWLFYNAAKGTFILCEWKRYPSPVAQVADTGAPWILKNGASVPNPLEQVARQLEAVRRVLRGSVRDTFFPDVGLLALNPFQCVYSPQVDATTLHERLRFGKVFGTLDDLALTVATRPCPAPLVVPDDARLPLAEMLADLFRCTVSQGVRRKLGGVAPLTEVNADQRMRDIHLEIAALHTELAGLLHAPARRRGLPVLVLPIPAEPVAKRATEVKKASAVGAGMPKTAVKQGTQATEARVTTHQRMKQHVERFLPVPDPKQGTKVGALKSAWLAALTDAELHQGEGVSAALFGSLVRPHFGGGNSFKKLLGTSLPAWCLAQAHEAGLKASMHPRIPGQIRLAKPPRAS
ncbi:hypothetical protein IWX75_001502 [Arthrobacter sp. CAN_A6]|uniref:hypothetical protein n=1 Tax=Arthrobacter sp. CAN_A6 TaxID=2787721 RepID=UPI0018CB40AE